MQNRLKGVFMRHLKKTLPLIVSNYSGLFGIEVKIQGTKAYTDSKTIVIPRLNYDSDESVTLAFGYLAHESAHIRYTDFKLVAKAHKKDNIFFYIFNILEDSRVEKLIGKRFIGVYENLEKLHLNLLGDIKDFKDVLDRAQTGVLLFSFISLLCAHICQKFKVIEYLKISYKKLLYVIEKDLLDRIIDELKKLTQCKNTEDCFNLTDVIYTLIKDYDTIFSDSNNHNNDYEKDNEKDDADTQNKCNALCDDTNNSDRDKKIESKEKNKDLAHKNCKKNTTKSLDLDGVLKDIDNIYNETNAYSNIPDYLRPLSRLLSDSVDIDTTTRDDFGKVSGGLCSCGRDDFKDSVIKATSLQRNRLIRKIYSLKEDLSQRATQGRKLNVKKIPLMPFGYNKIFLKKDCKSCLDTCVQILVDVSGSMLCHDDGDKSRGELACQCALALALALEGVEDLDVGVTYYPGDDCEYETALKFNEKASVVASRFDQDPKGSTPLAQALWHAFELFIKQGHKRNIVIVITDGIPDSIKKTQDVLDILEANNIEVYGIGINVSPIEKIIKKSIVIEDGTFLLNTSFNLFLKLFDVKYY